jgi:TATA element modulatory factor
VTTLEKDRDELAKREADARKKVRELNSKARKFEEEVETASDLNSSQEAEITQLKASTSKLEARLSVAEKDAQDAGADIERERKDIEAAIQSRLEEEKLKWRSEIGSGPGSPFHHDSPQNNLLRADSSHSLNQRKLSATDTGGSVRRSHTGRGHPADLSVLLPNFTDHTKTTNSRRGLPYPSPFAGPVRTPTDHSFNSRPDSSSIAAISPPLPINGTTTNSTNANAPPPIVPVADDLPTPSAHTMDVDDDRDTMRSSPQRTAAELISVSTAGAGPSVQLVERMSATVRRLEMEKAASREEMARLLAQRDEARDEVVALMREVDSVKETKEKLTSVEGDMTDMKGRYEAVLEMLGEKSEQCEELKNDVMDLKKIYRELVESTLR